MRKRRLPKMKSWICSWKRKEKRRKEKATQRRDAGAPIDH